MDIGGCYYIPDCSDQQPSGSSRGSTLVSASRRETAAGPAAAPTLLAGDLEFVTDREVEALHSPAQQRGVSSEVTEGDEGAGREAAVLPHDVHRVVEDQLSLRSVWRTRRHCGVNLENTLLTNHLQNALLHRSLIFLHLVVSDNKFDIFNFKIKYCYYFVENL